MPRLIRETDEGLVMENQHLEVRFTHGVSHVEILDRRTDFHWMQSPHAGLRSGRYEKLEDAVEARLRTAGGLEMQVTWELAEDGPEIRIRMSPRQETSFDHFAYPQPFLLDSGFAVVPHSQGVLYPLEDVPLQHFLDGQMLDAYTWDLSMPWFGLVSLPQGLGCLTIIETPDDAALAFGRYEHPGGSLLTAQPAWRCSQNRMAYERSVLLWFHIEGAYAAQAKRYRAYLKHHGLFPTTVAQRQEDLRGALHLALHIGDLSFADAGRICESFKNLGIEKAIVHLRNWQEEPYRTRGLTPPSENAGGAEGLRELAGNIRELGYIPGITACFRDTFEGFDGFEEDAVARDDRGARIHGGYAGVSRVPALRVCGAKQRELAEEHLPETMAAGPFDCVLLDGACLEARECSDQSHPLTRGKDLQSRRELLRAGRECAAFLGAEGGMEYAIPHVDFFAGLMSLARYYFIEQSPAPRRLNLDPRLRAPLFNLVFHELITATWHHQDAYLSAEDNGARALFDILYGNPPVVSISHPGTVDLHGPHLASVCRTVSQLHQHTAGQELETHGWLSEDRLIQVSRFGNGLQIVANFSREPFELPGGETVNPGACQALLPPEPETTG